MKKFLPLATTLLFGCPSESEPATIRDDPGVQRYASALLPWAPRASFDEYSGGTGAKLFRNIWHKRPNDQTLFEKATLLASLVALPQSLVAIYPPADADGLIIAHGGIDQPWERIPLTDIPVNDIGTVDAHATPDGGVIIGVRRRSSPQPITLYSWKPGGSVQSVPFARPAPSPSHPTNERCEDLAIGVSAAGDLDVVFRQNREQRADSQKLLHARRAAGQSTFTFLTIDETGNLPPPQGSFRLEMGCRIRLVYNQADQLQILSLTSSMPDSAFTTLNPEIGDPPIVAVEGHSFSGSVWTRGGPSATGGGGRPPDSAYWYTAQFDVAMHPAGFTISGVHRNVLNDPELTLAIGADPTTYPANLTYGQDLDEGNDPNAFIRANSPASGGNIIVDECGGIRLWYSESGLRHAFVDGAFSGDVAFCGGARRAPVVRFVDDPWGFFELPVVARGPRRFPAALCLMDETSLAICDGGHNFSSADPQTVTILGEEESPEIVSSTMVSPTQMRVVMSRPLAADETITLQLSDVHRGLPAFIPGPTMTDTPGEYLITFDRLLPNTLYRLHVGQFRPDKTFTYIDKKAPVVTFRTAP